MNSSVDYIIVGCGVFGLSTAQNLAALNPKPRIVLIDKVIPGTVTASQSPAKIIRSEYSSALWEEAAEEEVNSWGKSAHFTRTGWYRISRDELGPNLEKFEKKIKIGDIAQSDHPILRNADLSTYNYFYENERPGIVDASGFFDDKRKAAMEAGVTFISGTVTNVIQDSNKSIKGVSYFDKDVQKFFFAKQGIVIAMGAETNDFCEKIGHPLPKGFVPVGIAVAIGELSNPESLSQRLVMCDEVEFLGPFRNSKVVINNRRSFTVGDNLPSSTAVLKSDSEPHREINDAITMICPTLFEKSIQMYTLYDIISPSGAPLIDHLPDHPNVLIATGGNFHIWKFYQLLGQLATARITRGTLPPPWDKMCSWHQTKASPDEEPHPKLRPKRQLGKDQFLT